MSGTLPSGFAIPTTVNSQLYRIGSDGSAQLWSTINAPSSPLASIIFSFAGDINSNTGVYYIPAMTINSFNPFTNAFTYSIYLGTFNLDNAPFGGTVTPNYSLVTVDATTKPYIDAFIASVIAYASGSSATEPSGLFQDITLSPDGSKLVSFFGIENALFSIDLGTLTTTTIAGPASNTTNGYVGSTGTVTDEIGGIYYSLDGTLYAIQTDRGRSYEVNPATGELTLLSGTTATDQRGDAAGCFFSNILPVVFKAADATIVNNMLLINWTTLNEKNVSHYIIEASNNGSIFKEIDRVSTKAEGGNSSISINYESEIPIRNVIGMFQLLLLPFLTTLFNRMNRRNLILVSILTILIISIACNKSKTDVKVATDTNLFVRIKQVDIDQNYQYSKVISIVKK